MTNPTDATGRIKTTETDGRITALQKGSVATAPFARRGAKYRFLGISLALAGIALFLTGCWPSLFPYFTGKDLVFDPRLVGEWQPNPDVGYKTGPLEFKEVENAGQRFYRLIQREAGTDKKSEFSAHLFKIRNELFLDLQSMASTSGEGLAGILAVHGHFVGHIAQIEPELKMRFMSFPGLVHCLQTDSNSISCVPFKTADDDYGRIVITSQTPDLQKFVMNHLYDGLFGITNTYSRKGGSAKGTSGAEKSIEEKNKRIAEIDRRIAEIDQEKARLAQDTAARQQQNVRLRGENAGSKPTLEQLERDLAAARAKREAADKELEPLLKAAVGEAGSQKQKINALETKRDANAFFISGAKKFRAKDYAGAISDCARAIALDPKLADAFQVRGNAKLAVAVDKKSGFDEAIADFSRVIELEPNNANAYRGRAAAKLEKGDMDGFAADFNAANRLDKKSQ